VRGYAPLVRDFALTYPQLVRQAIAAGLDDQALRELRGVFEVAQRHFDGLYRAGGQPFICHMVRTASILLAVGQPLPLVEAALLHAAYDTHRYEHSTRPWPGPQSRRQLRRDVGSDVEGIVWAFHEFAWERMGTPEIQLRALSRASLQQRAVLALCVANDLENHMDLALCYRTGGQFKQRIESDGPTIVRLARELGMNALAEELETVFQETLAESLPAAVRWDRSRGYEVPVRMTSRTSSVARFASRVRRGLGRRLRALLVRPTGIRRRTQASSDGPTEPRARAHSRPRILVTGAAGKIGREVVPLLREHFSLRLLDVRRVQPELDDELVRADVSDAAALRRACRDVVAIVHLAGVDQKEHEFFGRMMPVNIDGTYQVFEAARCTGVGRVVFASTGQVVGAYPTTEWVDAGVPVRPSSVYACTKVFGEALARHYADSYGVATVCLRIGWFDAYDGRFLRSRPEMRRLWCSPRDLAQMIVKSIDSDVRFAVLFAVSDNPRRHWDLDTARETIGYVPQDRAPEQLVGDAT
jgi:NAD(P)-dependent dehydrogenase (short-subunit alcohol dehydrogenase family)